MPTGFNVETGCNLSAGLLSLSYRILDFMKWARTTMDRGPGNPIGAEELISDVASRSGRKIRGSDIRAMVNYLRREGHPIGSNGQGYFYARKREELSLTVTHLRERISAIQGALSGLESAFSKDGQRELF